MNLRRVLFLTVIGALLSGCYVTRQALHQNDLYNSRRHISVVLADPATSDLTRTSLRRVERILAFAKQQGLNTKGAYRYFIETKEPVVSYIVQAAAADKLEQLTWWFPVVGNVPYLGYFLRAERDEQAAELRTAGYDVYTTGAGAFSSLGWFDDPVFSSMLTRSEGDLAHLFLHELTHRTLWISGSPDFNENLAEYTATVLTPKYLGNDAAAVARYAAKRGDRALFATWLKDLRSKLEEVYANPGGRSRAEVLKAKQSVFAEFMQPPRKPKFQVADYVGDETWNNASVLGAALYAPDMARFERARACTGLEAGAPFLHALAQASRDVEGPFAALDSLCDRR